MNYGDYQPVGEEIAAEGGRVTYRASRRGSPRPDFALKVFHPPTVEGDSPPSPPPPEVLEADPCHGFLETARIQKSVVGVGSRRFAPIHAASRNEAGAWYATDFYPRGSLRSRIKPDVENDTEDLRGLVAQILEGLLDLQRVAGRSHGNLKPANVLLGGRAGTPLARTPVFLTDPHPGGDREALERADLRSLGEIILQLVTGREIHSFEDYNYPVRDSQAAEAFGRMKAQGGYWLEQCDRLVNPRLSLQQCTLAGLAQEPGLQPPRPVPGWVWKAGATVGTLLLVGVLAGVLKSARPPQAVPQEIQVAVGKPTAVRLEGSGQLGKTLNFTIVELPRLGSLSGTPPQIVYTAGTNARGTDRFTFKVSQGRMESKLATVVLNFPVPMVTEPTIRPNGGRYLDSVLVTLACTNTSAAIYYTLNGPEPTTNSTRYSQPFPLTGTNTVTAKAWAPDHKPSPPVSAQFEVSPTPVVAQPTITPEGGSYSDSVVVTLACTNTRAAIHYTTDGSNPSPNSTRYTQPLTLTNTTTVRVMAVAAGHKDSAVASAIFTLTLTPVVATPTIFPAQHNHQDSVQVTLACHTTAAVIYYTLDGTEPTASSAVYTRELTLTNTTMIRARALATGHKDSEIGSATFTVTPTPLVAQAHEGVVVMDGEPKRITLRGTGRPGAALTYTVVENPGQGSVTPVGSGPEFLYRPASNASGTDRFTFRVGDGIRVSEPATVTLTIQPARVAEAQDGPRVGEAGGAEAEVKPVEAELQTEEQRLALLLRGFKICLGMERAKEGETTPDPAHTNILAKLLPRSYYSSRAQRSLDPYHDACDRLVEGYSKLAQGKLPETVDKDLTDIRYRLNWGW